MIFMRPGLNQTGFGHPCSKTGLCLVRLVPLQKDTAQLLLFHCVIFTCEQLQGLCQGYDCTTKPVLLLLLLPGNPMHARIRNGMHFWVAPPCRRSDFPPPPAPAGSGNLCRRNSKGAAFCGSVAGPLLRVRANRIWVSQTPPGQAAAEPSFLARKVSLLDQVRGHVRSSQQRDYSPGVARPRPRLGGACAAHGAQEGAPLLSIRVVTYAGLGALLSVDAGCTGRVQRHSLSYGVTVNSCQERLGRVTVGNRRGGELCLVPVSNWSNRATQARAFLRHGEIGAVHIGLEPSCLFSKCLWLCLWSRR